MNKKLVYLIPAMLLFFGIAFLNINCGGEVKAKVEIKAETPPPPPPPPPKEEPKIEQKQADPWLGDLDAGDMAWNQRDYARARESYKAALEKGAPQGRVAGRIGYIDNKLDNNVDSALQKYEEAIGKTFDDQNDKAAVYSWRGLIMYNSGKGDAATADIDAALQINPKNVLALYGKALILTDQGKYKDAIGILNQVIAADATHHPAINLRAKCEIQEGEYEGSIADFTKAIELAPDLPTYYVNRAEIYIIGGEYDKALKDLNFAKDKFENAEAYAALGTLYMTKNWSGYDIAKAKEYTQKAVEINKEENYSEKYSKLYETAKKLDAGATTKTPPSKGTESKSDESYSKSKAMMMNK